jgi:probable phosphoglycerate mutase
MLRTRETTDIVNQVLNLPVSFEADLREVVFGGMEGKPLLPWFHDWMAGTYTPEGAETFAALTSRVGAAMRRVLAAPGPLLIVAHGGVFRAIRSMFGVTAEGLTPNAQPLHCEPVASGWQISIPSLDAPPGRA